jgi:hypothetical protein
VKQQADKEMTSIRRILDILGGLSHTQRARVMAFVNGRVADGSFVEVAAPNLSNVKLAPVPYRDGQTTEELALDMVKPSRGPQAPFPGERPQLPLVLNPQPDEATRRVMEAMGKHADAAGSGLGISAGIVGTGKVDVNQ